jgi:glycosyltransferase involved in cell wall biosynthesis
MNRLINDPDISVVFVTYNRSDLLIRCIDSLRDLLRLTKCSYELIIADDCSNHEHSEALSSIAGARIIRTPRNSGIGANVNNGLAHAKGRLILQLQDDWIWNGSCECMMAAIGFMRDSDDVGITQFTKTGTDLPVQLRTYGEYCFSVFRNDRVPWIRHCGVRPYSDQPHLKRREFIDDVGPYVESVAMTICENEYKRRVANQTRWKVAMINDDVTFVHIGSGDSFNPGPHVHPAIRSLQRFPGVASVMVPVVKRFVRGVDHMIARVMSA